MTHGKRGEVYFKKGAAFVKDGSANGTNVESLREAQAQNTKCFGGIEDLCYGYLKLKNWNSTTGEFDYRVIYIVDGSIKVGTQEDAEAEISGYKDIAGGLVRV